MHAVVRKGWRGFWLDLISGVLTAFAGLLVVLHPVAGASILTVFIGIVFLVGGIFRIGVGIAVRNPYAAATTGPRKTAADWPMFPNPYIPSALPWLSMENQRET